MTVFQFSLEFQKKSPPSLVPSTLWSLPSPPPLPLLPPSFVHTPSFGPSLFGPSLVGHMFLFVTPPPLLVSSPFFGLLSIFGPSPLWSLLVTSPLLLTISFVPIHLFCSLSLTPSHKIRQETNDESRVSTSKFTVLRHKNWSCKYTEDMYCDSDDNNVILLPVINTFYTRQADVDTKMTVGMFECMTQNEDMCTVGTSTCLPCEEAPRWMSMIWFSNNTSKSGDEQISMKETCGLCEGTPYA